MRFNGKELAYYASKCSSRGKDVIDREGVLFVKEKPDKLFKKGEG